MAKFSDRLKALRSESGLSQSEFAKLVGCTKSSINMYERGEREPGLEKLEAFADYFNVDMDFLLGKSEHRNKAAWLRSAQANLSSENNAVLLQKLQTDHNLDDFGVQFMDTFLKLSAEQRMLVMDFAYAILAARDNPTSEKFLDELEAEYKKILSGLAPNKDSSASNITSDDSSSAMTSEG